MTTVREGSCARCRHFENTALVLEREIAGLRTLSSGFASVRDRDGLCGLHDRYVPARAGCPSFAAHQVRD